MPAVMRGANAGRKTTRGGRGKAQAYAPAKLRGASGVGLKPQVATAIACAVLVGGLVLTLATGGRAQALTAAVAHGVDGRMGAMGFRVAKLRIKGASTYSAPYIVRALGVTAETPILGLDLNDLRGRAESVGWVSGASVSRLLPDTLLVTVDERPRLAVWQSGGTTSVVDPEGHVIPEADPGSFPDLPLVVGQGAAEAAAAIIPLVQTRPALTKRLEALVRVDGRRWDIRLKDGGLIQLPASGEDAALIQLDQLDQRSRILELGFARIDLRDPQMVAVRPRTQADGAGV
jgi:cell division protein FtsQ